MTGYNGALADAIAGDAAVVAAGDRLYEVNNVGGDPAVLRDALAASRTASELVLVFERDHAAMEEHVLQALNDGDIAAARRGLEDLAEGGGSVQPALVASMLRHANRGGRAGART